MSLSDLAAAGSFVSGLAVVITLFFLLLQMRQANRNQRAVLNQGYYNRSTSNTQWFAEPARIALMVKVMSGETNFTSEEVTRLNYSLRVLLLGA